MIPPRRGNGLRAVPSRQRIKPRFNPRFNPRSSRRARQSVRVEQRASKPTSLCSMKIFINAAIIVVAAGLGLAVGFVWRGKPGESFNSAGLPVASASPADSQTNLFRFTRKFTTVRTHDDSPLATQLERDLSMSSGVTRWLYWLEAIEKAAPSDFPRLARLAQGNATATKLLAARWAEVAPRHLFDTLVAAANDGRGFPASELTTVLFDEWPK